MSARALLILFTLGIGARSALAASEPLTREQIHGHQIVTQNCLLCHTPGSGDYVPLNKDAANGDDEVLRDVIKDGLVLMPGWKYTLSDRDIDDVIAYIRTIPVTAPPQSLREDGEVAQ
jgi:mono/diheme cytochrome c family protein